MPQPAEKSPMQATFDLLTAVFALTAAGFWFASAAKNAPLPITYWDQTPANDPFVQAVGFATRMNRFAALFSALSAACAVASLAARYHW
jgi:hypothetical protein